jgi:hypothetical protein
MIAAKHSKWITPERREGAHHWIARCGCLAPGEYQSPIRLEGGSRLLVSDPRIDCLRGGCGYFRPVSRSAGNGETQTPGARRVMRRAPRDVEVR